MHTKNISSWDEYIAEVSRIEEHLQQLKKKHPGFVISTPVFRGQAAEKWHLKATLEREYNKTMSCKDYYDVMKKICASIESVTKKNWILEEYRDPDLRMIFGIKPSNLEFMIYLRHHHFPSPLLDWTASPYIAAFFAFNPLVKEDKDTNVAIYAYQETKDGSKNWSDSIPFIAYIDQRVVTHQRHYLQQSSYTVCLQVIDGKTHYAAHENGLTSSGGNQDVITKYVLPRSLRKEFLKRLGLMDINAYSLFADEESFIRTLSNKEFIIDCE